MRGKIWIAVAVLVVLTGAAAGAGWYWMTGPLYRPGDVRAGKDVAEPLQPPAQQASAPRWTVAPGIELHHFEEGSGRQILTVHGGPGFAPTAPWRAGRELSGRYELVYYHQRGCGQSSRPIAHFPDPNFYQNMLTAHRLLGLPAQVGDIERIRRILGRDKLILMGHSFGALLAAMYAAEFPERVSALVLVAPANLAVLPSKTGDLFDLIRQHLPASMSGEYEKYLAEYFDFHGAFARTDQQSSAFYGRFGKYYVAAGGALPAGGDVGGAGFVPLAVFLGMGKHHDYSAALRAVKAPVLVIHGANDLQPEAASRNFAALFSNSRFVSVEGAGHFVFNDRPEEFAAVVRNFLDPLQ